MSDSSIEWTNKTWNPVTGCSKVSPGCAHCYAEALTMRYAKTWKVPGLPWTPENAEQNVILKPERLDQPLKWKTPQMVFVNSMSDLFHELVPDEYIAAVFGVMAAAPQHTFQILTKRPERMREWFAWYRQEVRDREYGSDPAALAWEHAWFDCGVTRVGPFPSGESVWPLRNVWLGTSIENRRFVGRADALRDTPAAVRFISAEPLLGPLDRLDLTDIDWLIVGGESGKGHRRFDWDWARELRDHCRESGTAFFLKQGGGHRPGDRMEDLPEDLRIREYPKARVPA